jgi:hypothetical protein
VHQEHAYLGFLALAQRAGQPQRVVGALAAIGLVIDDDKDLHPASIDTAGCTSIGAKPRTGR